MKRRILNILIATDQFIFCIITLGHSNPDWTISAAAWTWEYNKKWNWWMRPLIDSIFWFDADHCYKSFIKERY